MFSWEYFRIYIHSIIGFVKVEVDRNAVYIVQVARANCKIKLRIGWTE